MDDVIQRAEELLSKITQDPWHLVEGRKGLGPNAAAMQRFDIYAGPEILGEPPNTFMRVNPGFYQICHFHPVNPVWMDKSENYANNMKFIVETPKLVKTLLEEIKRLKGEK